MSLKYLTKHYHSLPVITNLDVDDVDVAPCNTVY